MLLYRIFILFYPKVAWLLSFSNKKAALWHQGRKGLFNQLTEAFHHNKHPIIWMHSSSLGEYEQGLPILESIRKEYPAYKIVVTFFSPSGYEVRKNDQMADYVFYLPIDSPSNASRFFNIVQPSLIIFIKYEFWYYYLKEAHQRNIPLLLLSGSFRENQLFFKWFGGFYRKMLSFFDFLFLQNEASASLLRSIVLPEKMIVSGDTRFDRVLKISTHFEPLAVIENFCKGHQTLVAGSTWTEDDEELDHFANTHLSVKCIIAPHDIGLDRITECKSLYKNSIVLSDYTTALQKRTPIPTEKNVLIIDNVGMLSRLYQYATVTYIGGGFGDDGIHNILEPAVFGKPVVFGPVYDKYVEGEELIELGGAFSIDNALDLERKILELLDNPEKNAIASLASKKYVESKAGATKKVMSIIHEKRLLIN
jgi:3-deoxy-D-manno-octulosonic-acid transferase